MPHHSNYETEERKSVLLQFLDKLKPSPFSSPPANLRITLAFSDKTSDKSLLSVTSNLHSIKNPQTEQTSNWCHWNKTLLSWARFSLFINHLHYLHIQCIICYAGFVLNACSSKTAWSCRAEEEYKRVLLIQARLCCSIAGSPQKRKCHMEQLRAGTSDDTASKARRLCNWVKLCLFCLKLCLLFPSNCAAVHRWKQAVRIA